MRSVTDIRRLVVAGKFGIRQDPMDDRPAMTQGRKGRPMPGSIEAQQAAAEQKRKAEAKAAKEAKKAPRPGQLTKADLKTSRAVMAANAALEGNGRISGRQAARVARGNTKLEL
ncbi:hypothetical protein ACFV9C_39445 [Kribbella sp. NPDC059898]|uniref:hypothetical protein n=1 Tax=Kribbella sp. NPDC059898 TaxID=3346995 RepID=UPI00366A2DC8